MITSRRTDRIVEDLEKAYIRISRCKTTVSIDKRVDLERQLVDSIRSDAENQPDSIEYMMQDILVTKVGKDKFALHLNV